MNQTPIDLTLNPDADYLVHIHTIVGMSYTTFGTLGWAFIVCVQLSMGRIKEAQLGNRFYYYIWHSLLCDQLCLITSMVYGGIVQMVQHRAFPGRLVQSLAGALLEFASILKGFFLLLTCWSRRESIKSQMIQSVKVGWRVRINCLMLYLLVVLLTTMDTWVSCNQFEMSLDTLSWSANPESLKSLCGLVSSIAGASFAICTTLGVIFLNIATILEYLEKKKNFVIILNPATIGEQHLQEYYRRERKMFIQCTLTSLVYVTCSCSFLVTSQLNLLPDPRWHVLAQFLNTVVMLDSSLMAVLCNSDLRQQMVAILKVKTLYFQQDVT